MKRTVVFSIVVFALLIITALPVFAGSTVFTGLLSTDDPIYQNGRPDNADCGGQIDDLLPEKYRYEFRYITVTATGTYEYVDLRNGNEAALTTYIDIEVAIYDGTGFDPLNPTVNCLSSMDDFNTIDLEAGKVYLLVVTSWDIPTVGDYAFSITGDGDVNEVLPSDCSVPLPADAVLSTLPAGAPAFYQPDAATALGFDIPAGTWYTFGTSGDFTHLWVTCGANPVWVPTNAVAP